MDLHKNPVHKRQRKPPKKRSEQTQKIYEARNRFLKAQNVTPEFYAAHNIYMKEIQKRFDSLWSRFTLRELTSVIILKGNSPKELFLMKASDKQLSDEFQQQLTDEYANRKHQLVFCLKEGIICVARSTNGWQRCKIVRLHENGTCDALLLDIGIIERIDWYDLRIIDGGFKPAAIGCSLVDFEPLAIPCSLVHVASEQRIERFSLQSHSKFRYHLEEQHDFYAQVHRSNRVGDVADVFLYYKFADQFYCINNVFVNESDSDDSSSDQSIRPMHGTTTATMLSTPMTTAIISSRSAPVEVDAVPDMSEPTTTDDELIGNNEEIVKSDEFWRISKPESVIIRNIVGIDEIYIFYTRYQHIFNKISFDIQAYVEAQKSEQKTEPKEIFWQANDYCLVVNPYSRSVEWARGKILAILSITECSVYLRDFGKIIKCRIGSLKSISRKWRTVRDFTWKVNLSLIRLVNGYSPELVTEQLNNLMSKEMAISVIEKSDIGCSYILWNVKRVSSALLPDKIIYENVNEKLVKLRLATTNISFEGINNFINPVVTVDLKLIDEVEEFVQGQNCSTIYDANGNQVKSVEKYRKITDKEMDVTTWLPAERIPLKKFVAFPEHVSKNLIIHVLEASRKTTADEIERILQMKNRDEKLVRRHPIEWKQDDPCFARFGYDKFYRATVRRVNFAKNTCMVRFIDYGNCEALCLDDLRKATMFGNVPALSHQYQLHNICSASVDGLWTEAAQSFCMKLIIEKHCDLEVVKERSSCDDESPQIDSCRLESLSKYKDVASTLVSYGHARFIEDPSEEPISI